MLTGNATEIAAVLAALNETGGIPISVSMVAEQNAKVEDCAPLTRIAWRTQQYAGTGRRHSSPGSNRGSPA